MHKALALIPQNYVKKKIITKFKHKLSSTWDVAGKIESSFLVSQSNGKNKSEKNENTMY